MRKIRARLQALVVALLRGPLGPASALFSYYLFFSLFPMLLFLSAWLSSLQPLLPLLLPLLPEEALAFLKEHLAALHGAQATALMLSGLFLFVCSLYAAAGPLLAALGGKEAAGPRARLCFAALFFLCILSLPLAAGRLPPRALPLLPAFCLFWLYRRVLPPRAPLWAPLPGLLLAAVFFWLASLFFRLYLETIAPYSLIYGSISAIIVLLIWLRLFGAALLLGGGLARLLLARFERRLRKRAREQ